jgi:hypothetical protein
MSNVQPTQADLRYIFGSDITYGREHADGEVELFDKHGYIGTRNRGTGVVTFAPSYDD